MMVLWGPQDEFGQFVENEDFWKSGIVLKIGDGFGAGLIGSLFVVHSLLLVVQL